MTNKKYTNAVTKIIAVIYFALLGYVTFFSRRREVYSYIDFRQNFNLQLLSKLPSYADLDENGKFYFIQDIFGNIILFLPFVMALTFLFSARLSNKKSFCLILLTTISIESAQYIFNVGVFDIDDIILNLTGGVMGMFLFNYLYRKFVV